MKTDTKKTVIITGASKGFGAYLVSSMVNSKFNLVITYNTNKIDIQNICKNIPKKIINKAINYYTTWYNDFDTLTAKGLIAYIRHHYTDYEQYLAYLIKYKGQTGNPFLYFILRSKVDEIIRHNFDHLLQQFADFADNRNTF